MAVIFDAEAPVELASTLSSNFYTSADLFEQSKDKIFARSWQFCCSKESLQMPGQMQPHTLLPGILDEPLLFTNDKNQQLRCLSNVCTHRGAILVDKPCQIEQIRCPYHSRRFNLDGSFMHMPEFEQAKNFPSAKDNLTNIPFATLGNFVFASLFPYASFTDVFADIQKRLYWLPLDKMYFMPDMTRDYHINAHWALYCENYLEGLHIPFVHKKLRSLLDFKHYSYEIHRYVNLQFALANADEDAFDIPPDSPDYGKKVAAYYYWVFPNTMLNFYPWGCSVNVVKPVSPTRTTVSFLPFVYDKAKMSSGAGGDLDTVELEDEAVVELVQRGIKSRFYDSGRYSPTMERGTHHMHQLIYEFMNTP